MPDYANWNKDNDGQLAERNSRTREMTAMAAPKARETDYSQVRREAREMGIDPRNVPFKELERRVERVRRSSEARNDLSDVAGSVIEKRLNAPGVSPFANEYKVESITTTLKGNPPPVAAGGGQEATQAGYPFEKTVCHNGQPATQEFLVVSDPVPI